MSNEQPRPVQTLIDPTRSSFITIVGRKGSGKSTLAARFFATYPYDRLAIDPMHDAHVPDDTERITAPLPPRWPVSTGSAPRWRCCSSSSTGARGERAAAGHPDGAVPTVRNAL
jgi:hypothetical protein